MEPPSPDSGGRPARGSRPTPRAGRAARSGLVLALLVGVAPTASVLADGPALPTPPPSVLPTPTPAPPGVPAPPASLTSIGEQGKGPAPPCSFAPLGASEFRLVDRETATSNAGIVSPTVDPWRPCRIYREQSEEATGHLPDSQRLQRVTTSTTPFVDDILAVTPPSVITPGANSSTTQLQGFDISPPQVVEPDHVYVYDRNDHYGVVGSGDAGWHWNQMTTGLEAVEVPHPDNTTHEEIPTTTSSKYDNDLAFARSNPRVGYFAPSVSRIYPTGQPGNLLFATADGGATWVQRPLPVANVWSLVIDPLDADHVLVAGAVGIEESRDGGLTWVAQPGPPSGQFMLSMLCAHSPSGLHVYVQTSDYTWWTAVLSGPTAPTWQVLPVAQPHVNKQGYDAVGVDPVSDMVVYARTDPSASSNAATQTISVVATQDAFATSARQQIDVGQSGYFQLSLQLDRAGDIFLWASGGCCDPPHRGDGNDHVSVLIGFRVSALQNGVIAIGPVGAAPPSSAGAPTGSGTTSSLPSYAPTTQRARTCSLPSVLVAGTTPSSDVIGSRSDGSSSLAFDGRYLDYTTDTFAGLIGRIDPVTCQPAPTLSLRASDFPGGALPHLMELTYVPTGDLRTALAGNRRGFLLASGIAGDDSRVGHAETPIYAIDPVTGAASPPLFGVNVGADPDAIAESGDRLLAYDAAAHLLWSDAPQPDGVTSGGLLTLDGASLPTCMTDFVRDAYRSGQGGSDVATWTYAAPNRLYVQLEDDITVLSVDSRTCQVLGGFGHPTFAEATDENEQLACDPLTAERANADDDATLLWIRDATDHRVDAFPIPDGYCPFPTTLAYDGPAVAKPGDPVTLCFTLSANLNGESALLPNEPVNVRLAGSDVGQGITDGSGKACVATTAPFGTGAQTVEGRFPGTRAYLASSALGTLLVPRAVGNAPHTGVVLPPPGPGAIPVPQPGPAGQPQPGSAPEPQTTVQMDTSAQAQAQSQAQSQSQAHTMLQPGVMVQPQRRRQLATQEQDIGNPAGYQASGLRRGAMHSPLPAIAMAFVVFGLAVLRRRPARAYARGRRSGPG